MKKLLIFITCLLFMLAGCVRSESPDVTVSETAPPQTITQEETLVSSEPEETTIENTSSAETEPVITESEPLLTEPIVTVPQTAPPVTEPELEEPTEAPPQITEPATGWEAKYAEYPYATEIWLYMKNLGWNDYICAGVMGNIMAEVGGNTLALSEKYLFSYNGSGYYGMCQWSLRYWDSNKIWTCADLETQCNYLRDTIEKEFNGFGYLSGYSYQEFLSLTNAQEAAWAFAKTYERCASQYVYHRGSNALKAYEYFVN